MRPLKNAVGLRNCGQPRHKHHSCPLSSSTSSRLLQQSSLPCHAHHCRVCAGSKAHTHTSAHTRACSHGRAHTCTHAHTHTQTHTLLSPFSRSARLWNASCAHPLMHLSYSTHTPSPDATTLHPTHTSTPTQALLPPKLPPSRKVPPPNGSQMRAGQQSVPTVQGGSNPPFLHEVQYA